MENSQAVLSVLPPPFEWCYIPAVQMWHMIDREGERIGVYNITSFWMAKYPITFEQFQVFVDDPKGFRNIEWWQGLAAGADHHRAPGTQEFTHAKCLPRENVSWYDAVAFCRWLSAQTNYEIRLPTEWEWQWTAQGSDGRAYPWGNDYIQGYANTNEVASQIEDGIYLEKTTPVGSYPQGSSSYGVMDMSGNVWEWCLNQYKNPAEISLSGNVGRSVRGGSWYDVKFFVRAASRNGFLPGRRSYDFGFRVVMLG